MRLRPSEIGRAARSSSATTSRATDQIREILEIKRRDAEPCARVKTLVERNLADVERKIGELTRLRRGPEGPGRQEHTIIGACQRLSYHRERDPEHVTAPFKARFYG